jgi:hypothetical protein
MIRRFLLLTVLWSLGFGCVAEAADVPSASVYAKPKVAKVSKPIKIRKLAKKADIVKPKAALQTANEPAVKLAPAVKPAIKEEQVAVSPDVQIDPGGREINLSWVLDPLSANADGKKKEGSASVEGNLVVLETGYVTQPYMVIELEGHIVKSAESTVRIDIKIAGKNNSVTWPLDDVKSGKFKVKLDAPMVEGKLPAYIPVSAIALVTNANKKGGAAMVSLEKITIRVGKVTVSDAQ